jgi:hypothetical protein
VACCLRAHACALRPAQIQKTKALKKIAPNTLLNYLRASPFLDSRVLGGGDFVTEIMREADQRVKRYLPAREKDALIERIVKENCGRERVGVGELRRGGQRQAVSRVRGKIGWILSREYGISRAEIARRVGVCTSAIAKAIQKIERQILKV